jgi:hypothetical protein
MGNGSPGTDLVPAADAVGYRSFTAAIVDGFESPRLDQSFL